jgi:hypothetical protein
MSDQPGADLGRNITTASATGLANLASDNENWELLMIPSLSARARSSADSAEASTIPAKL